MVSDIYFYYLFVCLFVCLFAKRNKDNKTVWPEQKLLLHPSQENIPTYRVAQKSENTAFRLFITTYCLNALQKKSEKLYGLRFRIRPCGAAAVPGL